MTHPPISLCLQLSSFSPLPLLHAVSSRLLHLRTGPGFYYISAWLRRESQKKLTDGERAHLLREPLLLSYASGSRMVVSGSVSEGPSPVSLQSMFRRVGYTGSAEDREVVANKRHSRFQYQASSVIHNSINLRALAFLQEVFVGLYGQLLACILPRQRSRD